MDRHFIFREIKDYVLIAVGVIIYTMGMAVFMLPYGLTMGGVAGVASIIYYATGLEMQITYFAINFIFLIVGVRVLGFRFCLKTIYAIVLVTVMLWAEQRLIEVPDVANAAQMVLPKLVGDQTFMAAVLGALMCGVGLAVIFMNNGSTGGTDIVAAIVNKYKPMSLGSVIMACDVVIISSCYFVFHDWARVIFGFVILIIYSMTLDYVIRRNHQSVQFMIFTRNPNMIADAITRAGHGATILLGEGWYTKTERRVVLCIVRKRQSKDIFRVIRHVDPYAMVSMTDTEGVYGERFDRIKEGEVKEDANKRFLVLASNNGVKLADARAALGAGCDVRSLIDVGCDTRVEFNSALLRMEPEGRVRFVKQYFGFDTFYVADDGAITMVEGDYQTHDYVLSHFATYADMLAHIRGGKTSNPKQK